MKRKSRSCLFMVWDRTGFTGCGLCLVRAEPSGARHPVWAPVSRRPDSLWPVPVGNCCNVCSLGHFPQKRTNALHVCNFRFPAMPGSGNYYRYKTKVLLIPAKNCYNRKIDTFTLIRGSSAGKGDLLWRHHWRIESVRTAWTTWWDRLTCWPGAVLRRMVDSGHITNMIFTALPAWENDSSENHRSKTGKTLHKLNGTSASVSDIKEIINGLGTFEAMGGVLLYLDEIQYLNKKQQQSLLEFIENGQITLIASTTENPYFYVYNAILSRSTVFEFKPVDAADIEAAVRRAFAILEQEQQTPLELEDGVVEAIALGCGGDVRKSINAVEMCVLSAPVQDGCRRISMDAVQQVSQRSAMRYDRDGDAHYDILSAFHKSIRGSGRKRGAALSGQAPGRRGYPFSLPAAFVHRL